MPTVRASPQGRDELIQSGPSAMVQIGYDRTFRPDQGKTPILPSRMRWALVDTGAFVSFIDSDLANTLVVQHPSNEG